MRKANKSKEYSLQYRFSFYNFQCSLAYRCQMNLLCPDFLCKLRQPFSHKLCLSQETAGSFICLYYWHFIGNFQLKSLWLPGARESILDSWSKHFDSKVYNPRKMKGLSGPMCSGLMKPWFRGDEETAC